MLARSMCLTAAALLAAGCAAERISRTDTTAFYHPDLVNHVAASGRVPTAIYGQPFDGDKAMSDEAVAAALALPGFYVPAPFEVTPDALAGEGPRVVLIFDPAVFPGAGAACTQPDHVGLAPAASELAVAATFCYGSYPASQAFLNTARPSGADDPGFQQAMGGLMAALLPSMDTRMGEPDFPD